MLNGKKILLGISGSIAAYKSATLVRLLIKAGADIKVVMTPAATGFIAPLTLSTLSKNAVVWQLAENDSWANHVMLGRWADVMLLAPLSCNTLAKMSAGLCDNILLAVYLSSVCPVIVAPAMDEDMWLHPATQANIQRLKSFGNRVIPVEHGELASGLTGDGRMAEPEFIVSHLENYFGSRNDFKGKSVLVTAGPTYEPIDPVRFIGNHSSGKMGVAIAEAFLERGADVTLVCGPVNISVNPGVRTFMVSSAAEMFEKCLLHFPKMQIAVMSAAVADYSIQNPAAEKIKKNGESLILEMHKTKDILKSLGSIKTKEQLLVGFALETNNEKQHAIHKLVDKNADLIVLNSLREEAAGFGYDTNKITIFGRDGFEKHFQNKPKKEVAADILNTIIELSHAQN